MYVLILRYGLQRIGPRLLATKACGLVIRRRAVQWAWSNRGEARSVLYGMYN